MKTIASIVLSFFSIITYSQTDKEKFVGKWISNDTGHEMEVNFKADGSGVVDGDVVRWSVGKPGILIVEMDGDKQSYNYTFNATGFRVSGGDLDMPLNFRKFASSNSSSAPAPSANATGKKIDQSLVGKWCYVNVSSNSSSSTEQCITINSNGTYEYYSERSTSGSNGSTASQASDTGSWWIEGTRVYYRSQSQGDGSYELVKQNHPKTGDPMIVLDGTAYVTFYKKSPW